MTTKGWSEWKIIWYCSNYRSKALLVSKKKGAYTIGFLGNDGGTIKKIVDIPLVVKSNSTPRIQEAHRVIYHLICERVEEILEKGN